MCSAPQGLDHWQAIGPVSALVVLKSLWRGAPADAGSAAHTRPAAEVAGGDSTPRRD